MLRGQFLPAKHSCMPVGSDVSDFGLHLSPLRGRKNLSDLSCKSYRRVRVVGSPSLRSVLCMFFPGFWQVLALHMLLLPGVWFCHSLSQPQSCSIWGLIWVFSSQIWAALPIFEKVIPCSFAMAFPGLAQHAVWVQ